MRGLSFAPRCGGEGTALGALRPARGLGEEIQRVEPGRISAPAARHPALRAHAGSAAPGREVERIAHYLLRDTRVPGPLAYTLHRGQVWEGLDSDQVEAERAGHVKDFALESLGKVHHQSAIEYRGWLQIPAPGRYSFHLRMNGGSLRMDGKEIIRQEPSNRRGVKTLQGAVKLRAGWREIALTYFHTGREPEFSCEWEGPGFERRPIPSSMLSVSDEVIPPFQSPPVDAALAARGRNSSPSSGARVVMTISGSRPRSRPHLRI